MTTFWILAALLSVVVLALITIPLLRKSDTGEEPSALDFDAAVYKSQLEEVARDHARGELNDEEAESARVEIARRLLQADAKNQQLQAEEAGLSKQAETKGQSIFIRMVAGIVLSGSVIGASLALYLSLGAPYMPDFPFAERAAEREAARVAQQQPDLTDRIESLQAELKANPDNQHGWLELGALQIRIGEYAKAVFSYAEAVRINRQSSDVVALYAESLVLAANGVLDDEIKSLFEEALAMNPNDARSHFYLAQYEYQKGNPEKAVEMILSMLQEAPADVPWRGAITRELVMMADEIGLDISDQLASLPQSGPVGPFAGGPTSEDMANAADMTAEDRNDMINSMVDGLAARLEENPDVVEDWQKLARAATVLGQEDRVTMAYDNLVRLQGENVGLLLEKADALLQISKGRPSPEILQTMGRVLKLDPNNPDALWFSGMAALAVGDKVKARQLFDKVLENLGEDDPQYAALKAEMEDLLK